MMKLLPETNIDFVGKRFIFFGISTVLLAISFISVAVKGPNLGLDFTGGTMLQLKFEAPVQIGQLRDALDKAGIKPDIQSFDNNSFAIRLKGKQEKVNEVGDQITKAITDALPEAKFSKERVEYVGPAVGRDLSKKAIWALVLAMFGIIIYLAFRFNNPLWGTAGVVGIFHDVLITVGLLSVTNRQIDLIIVAALLTIAGYSINDTIVIFDRMRENIRLNIRMPIRDVINKSMNETLSRTIITSLTVFMASMTLFLFGGDVINDFAFAMVIGTIIGVYSTIGVATPLLYQWSGEKNTHSAQAEDKPAQESADRPARKKHRRA